MREEAGLGLGIFSDFHVRMAGNGLSCVQFLSKVAAPEANTKEA